MTGDSRLARAIPFSEYAPDHVLRFTTGDLIDLEALYCTGGHAPHSVEGLQRRMDVPWTAEIERRLKVNDASFIRDAVRLGVKRPGGFERPEFRDGDLNDLPFGPAAVSQKIADAIILAITGRSYADLIEERAAAEAAAAAV